jgi:hypothetical protein
MGANYESIFDRLEVIIALVYADLTFEKRGHVWGPIGRFGWKYGRGRGINPYGEITEEIVTQKESWPLLKVGLFGGKSNRALEIAKSFAERLSKLNWW